MVISRESQWKAIFDVVLLFASVYNTFSQAFYSAFGEPDQIYRDYGQNAIIAVKFLDEAIEILFYFDFIFCFCQEYKDEETYTTVTEIKKIAKHYLKGSCFFDGIACIPFQSILAGDSNSGKVRLFRLLKLFRVPRLVELLNVNRIK